MRKLVVASLAFVLASCSTYDAVRFLAQSPQPTSEAEASGADRSASGASAADAQAQARAEWKRYANPATASKTWGAGSALDSSAVSLQPGQWAVYRSLEDGQVKAVLKMALVGKSGDAWIYEFASYSEKDANVLQEAVKGMEDVVRTGNADKAQVIWVKVKDEQGRVETLDGAMLGMGGDAYKNMLTTGAIRNSGAAVADGPVTVPAGTFSATWRVDTPVAHGRSSENGTAWVSTLVPLWHMVKAVSANGKTVLELVDFGTTGYRSALP